MARDGFSKGIETTSKKYLGRIENMNHQTINQMQSDQYVDDLDHKIEVYDGVKDTLKLCETMIQAMDATSDKEARSKNMLISNLLLARSQAMLAATDVEIEKRGLSK